jgi:hypothetical protein
MVSWIPYLKPLVRPEKSGPGKFPVLSAHFFARRTFQTSLVSPPPRSENGKNRAAALVAACAVG